LKYLLVDKNLGEICKKLVRKKKSEKKEIIKDRERRAIERREKLSWKRNCVWRVHDIIVEQ
jgi:hypothetical protein